MIRYNISKLSSLNITSLNRTTKGAFKSLTIENKDLGETFTTTPRFMSTFNSLLEVHPSYYNNFTPDEVLARLIHNNPDRSFRFALESDKMLAISAPEKNIIPYNQALELINNIGSDASYKDGVVTTMYRPNFKIDLNIGGEAFQNKVALEIPVDGYQNPLFFLSLLRIRCMNGMVAYHSAFKSKIEVGKVEGDIMTIMSRAITSFNNDRGYDMIATRLDAAQKYKASLAETDQLRKLFVENGVSYEAQKALEDRMGNITKTYGIRSTDDLNLKQKQRIPSECSVFDLINMATEITTHYKVAKPQLFNGFVGQLIGTPSFDLEGVSLAQLKDKNHEAKYFDTLSSVVLAEG